MTAVFTPGAYLARRRKAVGLSIDDVAAQVATDPRLKEHARRAWLAQMEADQAPISIETIRSLGQIFPFSRIVLQQLADHERDPGQYGAPRVCRKCACSELDPCTGPSSACAWAGPDLCSECSPPSQSVASASLPFPESKGPVA